MLTVQVVCIGTLKEKYWKEALEEYLKRLKPFCRLEILELPEQRLQDRAGEAEIASVVEAEGKRLLAKIPAKAYLLPMCIEGKQMDSIGFSKLLEQAAVEGYSTVSFVIGGSYGLADTVKQAGKQRLSMSKMTFPHQLARVMLLEQIYRAFMISSGSKYHK